MATDVRNGHTESMRFIFGLSSKATAEQVRLLLGRGEDSRVELMAEYGQVDAQVALVHLPADRAMARHIARRINLHHRALQVWVPVLAWS